MHRVIPLFVGEPTFPQSNCQVRLIEFFELLILVSIDYE